MSFKPPRARVSGFTLLELLLVVVIAGITLGVVSLSAFGSRSDLRALQDDARRVALLLQLSRDEAILRSRPTAFEVEGNSYRFLVRNDQQWQLLPQDGMLRQRKFRLSPVHLSIQSGQPDSGQTGALRIAFGREPVDQPFVLTLNAGDASVAIRADGVGHFVVE